MNQVKNRQYVVGVIINRAKIKKKQYDEIHFNKCYKHLGTLEDGKQEKDCLLLKMFSLINLNFFP